MITGPATTDTLARLRASRAQEVTVLRWLRPLGPVVLAVVVGVACTVDPRPGLTGRHLAVSLALAALVLGGLGTLVTAGRLGDAAPRRLGRLRTASLAALFASSVALVWLQPQGAAVAGIFFGLSLLAPLLQRHRSVPLAVVALLSLGVVAALAGRSSVASALLNAVMLASFYGVLFLAARLGEANRLAERLVIELEESRAAQAQAAGLAERQRLAREMHDVLAHSLAGLMLQLEGARMLAAADPSDPRLPEAVNRAHQLGRSGLAEARRAIAMLRDDELPGPDRLAALAAQFERDHGIPCRLTVSGPAHPLDSEARLALYRVAQEALTNIAKHANPRRVELRLCYEPSTTRLTVEDFAQAGSDAGAGAGPLPPPAGAGGYGLTGMRERAELLGGTLRARPTPTGFQVELGVPA